MRAPILALPLLLALVPLSGCASCGTVSGIDAGRGDTGSDAGCDPSKFCGLGCCGADEVCSADERCLPVVGTCDANGLCPNDGRCIGGSCVPWEEKLFPWDTMCTRDVEPGVLRPSLQCAWEGDPATDPSPGYHAVRHTPLVVDFGLGGLDSPLGPSIVILSKGEYLEGVPRVCESSGAVVVLDGRTCGELYVMDAPGDEVIITVTPAAADLDGDGRPEIVAAAAAGGLLAFTYDAASDQFVRMWHSTEPGGADSLLGGNTCLWGGITIADIDGGNPEIFYRGAIHDSAGLVLGSIPGYQPISWGNPMVVVDADLDGLPEVLEGYGTYEFAPGAGFTLEVGWVGTGGPGFVAVADFGDFPGAAGDAPGRPEVVVVNAGVRLQTVLGEVVFSRPGGAGTGGPPTIADFDGDGRPEFGVAFGDAYSVFDLDCAGAPAGCAGDGILWSSPSQDLSSARTGSSVFDFNGDGRAEVVYGDECFVRVYDGPTGTVLFSQGRFSSTWEEYAVVADVDGDAAAEIVLPASSSCNPGYCGDFDASFEGVSCDSSDDCPGGPCDMGYCRCADDSECGGAFTCTPPSPAVPGVGNVCRARHEGCLPGVRVYRDARDRWAGSRAIWNEHAYHVTNVEDDGSVLPFDVVAENWSVPGLNNFRQNVQGTVGPLPAADLTVRDVTGTTCDMGAVSLSATVCNRGAVGADSGIRVSFVDSATGAVVCQTWTADFLAAGMCETVSCDASLMGDTSITAYVNDDSAVGECIEDNNASNPSDVQCVG